MFSYQRAEEFRHLEEINIYYTFYKPTAKKWGYKGFKYDTYILVEDGTMQKMKLEKQQVVWCPNENDFTQLLKHWSRHKESKYKPTPEPPDFYDI